MAIDLGRRLQPHVLVDASAAKGIAARRGVGRIRHLDAGSLWVQKHVTDKRLLLSKVAGTINPANLGTKHVERASMFDALKRMGFDYAEGRSSLSLRASL